MPAHGDNPGRDDAPGRGPAGRQDRELAGAVQQEPARRGPGGVPATAMDTAIWNSTRLVASLNRLSAWTSAWTRGGRDSRRPSALTATGSVLASTAPSTNAMLAGTAATAPATAATAAADASTRPTARMITGRHTARTSRQGSSSLAAYSSGGSTTRLTTSGGTRTAGTPGSKPISSPATTSNEGAGTRSRPGEHGDHRAQHDQQQHRFDTAHGTDPVSWNPSDDCRPGFPAHHEQPTEARGRSRLRNRAADRLAGGKPGWRPSRPGRPRSARRCRSCRSGGGR